MVTYHQWSLLVLTRGQFHWYKPSEYVTKLHIFNYCHILQGPVSAQYKCDLKLMISFNFPDNYIVYIMHHLKMFSHFSYHLIKVNWKVFHFCCVNSTSFALECSPLSPLNDILFNYQLARNLLSSWLVLQCHCNLVNCINEESCVHLMSENQVFGGKIVESFGMNGSK